MPGTTNQRLGIPEHVSHLCSFRVVHWFLSVARLLGKFYPVYSKHMFQVLQGCNKSACLQLSTRTGTTSKKVCAVKRQALCCEGGALRNAVIYVTVPNRDTG